MPSAAQSESGAFPHPDDLRAYVEYLRDLGVYDLLSRDVKEPEAALAAWAAEHLRDRGAVAGQRPEAKAAPSAMRQAAPPARPGVPQPRVPNAPDAARLPASPTRPAAPTLSPFDQAQQRRGAAERPGSAPTIQITPPTPAAPVETAPVMGMMAPDMPAPKSFNQLAPLPTDRVAAADKAAALQSLRNFIGDCTRCPLAYAGRHSIVFADGDPNARLMFVGEGPGADEDEHGLPFVGKAGQLLNNMIGAMGLKREQVYIANIVKCRPPKNRVPEPVEANTCSPFLLQQIDVVRPEVIVALGGTAATYLLGVKQSLTSLRGQWFDVRGAKAVVTYHPAFLLRDPRQKGEAWKDLQRVMGELKLTPPARA